MTGCNPVFAIPLYINLIFPIFSTDLTQRHPYALAMSVIIILGKYNETTMNKVS